MELNEAIALIERSADMPQLIQALHRIAQDYGFSSFTFIDAGRPELDVPFYTGTHPKLWERTYLQNEFVKVDPALVRVRRTNTPFRWSDLAIDRGASRKRSGAAKMMDAAREQGFKNGFVVPFHYRDKLGHLNSSSTVFFWEDDTSWMDKLFGSHRFDLNLIMIYWVQRSVEIVATHRRVAKEFTIVAEPEAVLTARERDVMAWAARGKTAADTADILNLSVGTVEDYIKSCLRKLDAVNKTNAVARCISRGLIDL